MSYLLIFIAALCIGVIFNLPKGTLWVSAIIATLGSVLSDLMGTWGSQPQESAFAAAFFVAISAEILARKMKVPALVLAIPGIIPLVPGKLAYRSAVYFVDNEQLSGSQTLITVGLTAIGIASGLLLASSISRRITKPLLGYFTRLKKK